MQLKIALAEEAGGSSWKLRWVGPQKDGIRADSLAGAAEIIEYCEIGSFTYRQRIIKFTRIVRQGN